MCILIDTCAFAAVFKSTDNSHKDFYPVYEWIKDGPGKILYGGTKYREELKPFLSIVSEFSKARKTIHLSDEVVDQEEKVVKQLETDPDFDDPHLVAILRISKAILVCTKEKRAIKFLKKKALYPKKQALPKIYASKKNQKLLNSKNIPPKFL